MKLFYTKEELEKLTKTELEELASFGPNKEYFYSDLQSVENIDNEYVFRFKSNTSEIYTQDPKTYEEVKFGKIRFDLIMKSMEAVEHEGTVKDEFFESIKSDVSTNMEIILTDFLSKTTSISSELQEATRSISAQNRDAVKKIKGDSDTALKSVQDAVQRLNSIDVDAYNVRMKKIDKIIDAFSTLLEN